MARWPEKWEGQRVKYTLTRVYVAACGIGTLALYVQERLS
jgi:hypothetical protein